MTTIHQHQPHIVRSTVSSVGRAMRYIYLIGTVLFTGSVALQVFFAGAALLVSSDYLEQHRAFAHIVELVTFAVALMGSFAQLPRRILLLSWLPVGLFILQYIFLYAIPSMGLPSSLRALHAVNALVIFWNSVYLVQAGWTSVRQIQEGQDNVL